jgi:hypothetical protein
LSGALIVAYLRRHQGRCIPACERRKNYSNSGEIAAQASGTIRENAARSSRSNGIRLAIAHPCAATFICCGLLTVLQLDKSSFGKHCRFSTLHATPLTRPSTNDEIWLPGGHWQQFAPATGAFDSQNCCVVTTAIRSKDADGNIATAAARIP